MSSRRLRLMSLILLKELVPSQTKIHIPFILKEDSQVLSQRKELIKPLKVVALLTSLLRNLKEEKVPIWKVTAQASRQRTRRLTLRGLVLEERERQSLCSQQVPRENNHQQV